MKKFKQLSIITLVFALSLAVSGCSGSTDTKAERQKFEDFLNEEFVKATEEDYLSRHILLENPEKFGVDPAKADVKIGELANENTIKENKKESAKAAKAFKEIDRDSLSSKQKDVYDTFRFLQKIDTDLNDGKYDYTPSLLESMTGMHTQLPTLFADLTLRNEQDVKDVILLMKDTKPYMDSVLEYTKKQQDKGTLMLDITSVKEYCQKVIDNQATSSVITGLNNCIDQLTLDETKTAQYKQELKEAFDTSFIPAYQDIVKTMDELDASKNNTKGLYYLKNGKKYYEILFRASSGSDKSVKEMKKDIQNLANQSLKNMQKIVMKNQDAYDAYVNNDMKTDYNDFPSMLDDLKIDIEKDFPSVGELDYRIAPIGADLASGGVAAYFNIPAIDRTTPMQIRVNMLEDALDINAFETFSTIAHEGLPGHMYQISYSYKNLTYPWSKAYANVSGYTEGYATYVELYALKYLKDVPEAMIEIQRNMTVLQNCLVALTDIGIHYEGWSKGETQDFLNQNGLAVTEIDGFYYQIQANPTAFIPYYVGYMQFDELKTKAKDALGDSFNDKKFHEAILRSGAAPFSVVERNVDAYIKNAK